MKSLKPNKKMKEKIIGMGLQLFNKTIEYEINNVMNSIDNAMVGKKEQMQIVMAYALIDEILNAFTKKERKSIMRAIMGDLNEENKSDN